MSQNCFVPDPIPDIDATIAAFVASENEGTTTQGQLLDLWWVMLAMWRDLDRSQKRRLRRVIDRVESRLPADVVAQLNGHIADVVEQRIAEAFAANLPVMVPGGIHALAETDLATAEAKRRARSEVKR